MFCLQHVVRTVDDLGIWILFKLKSFLLSVIITVRELFVFSER
jgi:hypothetical protein